MQEALGAFFVALHQYRALAIGQIIFSLLAILLGIPLLGAPAAVIAFQKAAYRMCNWNIEPINLAHELRMTRFMGVLVIVCGVIGLVYCCVLRA